MSDGSLLRMRQILVLVPLLVLGCHDDDDHDHGTTTRPQVCEEIVENCHSKDPGSGPIHDCHESAESTWTAEQCTSNASRCRSLCVGGGDSGTDATSDAPTEATRPQTEVDANAAESPSRRFAASTVRTEPPRASPPRSPVRRLSALLRRLPGLTVDPSRRYATSRAPAVHTIAANAAATARSSSKSRIRIPLGTLLSAVV